MLIDCPKCGGERGVICLSCNGNGCWACHNNGVTRCPTCDGEGDVTSEQFRQWAINAAESDVLAVLAATSKALDEMTAGFAESERRWFEDWSSR